MSEATMPTITAVIPTFNRAQYVGEAIDSILAQTQPVSEIIVVDDGSTDDTAEIIKKYGPAIRCISQQNRGPAAARNRGIREARGDFVAFLDSDDLWVPKKIELQLDFFGRYPEIEFVFGNMVSFSTGTDRETPEIRDASVEDYLLAHSAGLENFFELLIVQNCVPTPTVMARHTSLKRVGDFDESRFIAEDLDYWLRAAICCRWGFVNSTLLKRRRHPDNLIASWTKRNVALVEVLERTARAAATGRPGAEDLINRKLREVCYDLGSAFLKQRDFKNAYTYLTAGRPLRTGENKWRLKLLAASALRHWPSKHR
jgi:glycosyltransferase involved in cell wall biosynthesis